MVIDNGDENLEVRDRLSSILLMCSSRSRSYVLGGKAPQPDLSAPAGPLSSPSHLRDETSANIHPYLFRARVPTRGTPFPSPFTPTLFYGNERQRFQNPKGSGQDTHFKAQGTTTATASYTYFET
ncbi:hypothetical protein CABS02_07257, partial [Colletotrichum abscissum]